MSDRTEIVELTNMCMIFDGSKVLIQHRKKNDWDGIVFPGGHVEKFESFTDSVIREVWEETGLIIKNPIFCGIKQLFKEDNHRYIVFLYKTDNFQGNLKDSDEGKIEWVEFKKLESMKLAFNFEHMFKVFNQDDIQELFYTKNGDHIYF